MVNNNKITYRPVGASLTTDQRGSVSCCISAGTITLKMFELCFYIVCNPLAEKENTIYLIFV